MDTESTTTDKCTDAEQTVHTDEEHQTLIRAKFVGEEQTQLFISFQIGESGNWVKFIGESENTTVPRKNVESIKEEW